ncbi:hypothetical protein Cantr_06537 [Candida viswanathii]|uniref:Uncharacterized protein n=1 Tax=Candida viswanathii TaxID=5486 RepID=A0A367XX67_9ASCO|nr:hypothetical protein Cantr_06537 [Candida viswanathii]
MPWLLVSWLISLCLANTETYLIRIPQYYDIAPHAEPISDTQKFTRHIEHLNDTHRLILDYPIQTIDKIDISNVVKLQYNTVAQPQSTLVIRINNYEDSLFTNDDLLNVKLCWPATSPYDFHLSHQYLHTHELSEELEDNFELYLVVDYRFYAYTFDEAQFLHEQGEELEMLLYINKLPNKYVPIPLELYDFILYLVDATIFLSWNVLPYVVLCYF